MNLSDPYRKRLCRQLSTEKIFWRCYPLVEGSPFVSRFLLCARKAFALVISPLIALMRDQVFQLRKRDIPAAAIHSSMTKREIDITLDNAIYSNLKFLYVSPERIQTDIFKERVQKMEVNLLAIDESHCISQWGYDFRPSYLQITELRQLLPEVPCMALTASATPQVQEDIVDKLQLKNHKRFEKSFIRENLSYVVRNTDNKEGKLLEILERVPGSAIIYVRSRRQTEMITKFLSRRRISADFYHAGLSDEQRSSKQDRWIKNQIRVMCSTNAFGMGIDKPDVRLVIHMDIPGDLESYYQEAGRAGRDERRAYATIIYHETDVKRAEQTFTRNNPDEEKVRQVYQALANYYKIAVGSSEMLSYDFDLEDFSKSYNLKPSEVFPALKKLEEAALILVSESIFHPSKILINCSKTVLYEFQVANAVFDKLVKGVLRLYGGELFSQFVSISERQIADLIDLSSSEVARLFSQLHEKEIIFYDPRKEKPQLTFLTARQDTRKMTLPSSDRRQLLRDKLDTVLEYLTLSDECRAQYIAIYFGEKDTFPCGVCDYCISQKSKIKSYDYQVAIKDALLNQPCFPEELLKAIRPRSEEKFHEVLQILLTLDEVKKMNDGRLTLTNNQQ